MAAPKYSERHRRHFDMERFVASAPQPGARYSSSSVPPSVSPLAVSSPASLTSGSLQPIVFSAIQSAGSDADAADVSEGDAGASEADGDMLSERQLIARGRVLLQAYQSQKKQWLASQYSSRGVSAADAPGSSDSSVNIFQSTMDSHVEHSKLGLFSPSKHAVAHLTTADAPSIDTKLDELLPPPPPRSPPPSSMLSTFSIGPMPASELKMNEPLSGNKSEKSWTDFMQLLKTNGRMMDAVDEQLGEIWGELVAADEKARGPQTSVDKLSGAVTQLLQQKREAEVAIAKLAEVLGSRVFLTGKMTDDAVQFVSNQLRLELEASQALVEQVKEQKVTYKKEHAAGIGANGRATEGEQLLRQQLQEKEQQLQASQAAVAKLKDQLERQKETAADRQAQFERALDVKLREIDALCSDVELPTDYERIKTAEGVACYRRTGHNSDNELEDPRVPIVIQQRSAAASAATSADASKEFIPTSNELMSSGSTRRPRGVSAMARDYAAPENMMRRSFSTPHISHDSNVFEDIHIPPDDGRKHTIEDFSTPLPAGWEMRVTASGAVFFFNKYTTTTTWTDPRLLGTASASSVVNVASQHKALARNSSATTSESRPSRSNSTAVITEPSQREEEEGIKYFDVVFKERGPIGIHFQANVPDAGATVRSLLPDMAAAKKEVLEPFDGLVAVNKNAVDSAPFRHVMLLLQGGLRPLTLTFKRDPNCPRRPTSPAVVAAPSSDGSVALLSENGSSDAHLDEEVVIDEGTVVDLDQLRVPVGPSPNPPQSQEPAASGPVEEDDMDVADVIISNIFSLFWKPPEATGEVQTV
jgi:hypothetical protein